MKCLWDVPEVSIWQLGLIQNVSMDFKAIQFYVGINEAPEIEQDKSVEIGVNIKGEKEKQPRIQCHGNT